MPTIVEVDILCDALARKSVEDTMTKLQLQISPQQMTGWLLQEILVQTVKGQIMFQQMAVASGLVEPEPPTVMEAKED